MCFHGRLVHRLEHSQARRVSGAVAALLLVSAHAELFYAQSPSCLDSGMCSVLAALLPSYFGMVDPFLLLICSISDLSIGIRSWFLLPHVGRHQYKASKKRNM